MVDFGQKLKTMRHEQGMTQQQLAGRLGVTKSVISAYEKSVRYPSYDILMQVALLFHVSTDYLLGMRNGASIDIAGLGPDDVELVRRLIQRLRTGPG